MGYSCATRAASLLGIICKLYSTKDKPNVLTIHGKEYFFERGREQTDGAITGTLYQMLDDGGKKLAPGLTSHGTARKVGRVRIEAEGIVAAFPRMSCSYKREVEHMLYRMENNAPDLLRKWAEGATLWSETDQVQ